MVTAIDRTAMHARVAGAVAYGAQGLCFAALVTRIPTLQDRFALTDTALAGLLALVPVVAGLGSVAAGAMIARVGSAPVLRVVGPIVPLALVATGLSSSVAMLIVSLIAVGFGLGSVDATMSAHAVSVESRYGRSLMGSFFAVFSLAGIVGAGLAALAAGTDLALGAFFALIAVAVIPVQLVAGPRLLKGRVEIDGTIDDVSPHHPNREHVRVPWRPIVLIGLALAAVYVADSAASNWSAVYLNDALGSTEALAALAYAFYALTTLAARLVVDRAVTARGPVLLVRLGGGVAVAAALLVALAPSPAFGLVAFALLGLGIAPVIPLAFSAAAQHDPLGTGVAVSRVNVFNYVGFVLGAPLIGIVADMSSLRWAFAALIPVLLIVVVLAPAFAVRTRA